MQKKARCIVGEGGKWLGEVWEGLNGVRAEKGWSAPGKGSEKAGGRLGSVAVGVGAGGRADNMAWGKGVGCGES